MLRKVRDGEFAGLVTGPAELVGRVVATVPPSFVAFVVFVALALAFKRRRAKAAAALEAKRLRAQQQVTIDTRVCLRAHLVSPVSARCARQR